MRLMNLWITYDRHGWFLWRDLPRWRDRKYATRGFFSEKHCKIMSRSKKRTLSRLDGDDVALFLPIEEDDEPPPEFGSIWEIPVGPAIMRTLPEETY